MVLLATILLWLCYHGSIHSCHSWHCRTCILRTLQTGTVSEADIFYSWYMQKVEPLQAIRLLSSSPIKGDCPPSPPSHPPRWWQSSITWTPIMHSIISTKACCLKECGYRCCILEAEQRVGSNTVQYNYCRSIWSNYTFRTKHCTTSFRVYTSHSKHYVNILQFFQWLVFLQCFSQGYGSNGCYTTIHKPAVWDFWTDFSEQPQSLKYLIVNWPCSNAVPTSSLQLLAVFKYGGGRPGRFGQVWWCQVDWG